LREELKRLLLERRFDEIVMKAEKSKTSNNRNCNNCEVEK